MSARPMSRLLASIFADARAARLFTVLRNGERLPHALDGHDLDVSVMPGHAPADVVAFLVERGRAAGWTAACVSRRPHMIAVSLVAPAAGDPDAIHFDVFDGITLAGVPLVSPARIAAESTVRDGVRSLTARGRVFVTLAHHLAWNGGLTKQRYRDELAAVLGDPLDRAWLIDALRAPFGDRIAGEVWQPDALGSGLDRRRRAARVAALRRALLAAPLATCRGLVRYASGQLPSFVRPPGLIARPGDGLAGSGVRLDLTLACRIAPHAFAIADVRARHGAHTVNGPRYERTLARTWARAALVRWVAPSLFLWYQAKRGRVILIDRLPAGLRLLRRLARPAWLAPPSAAESRHGAGLPAPAA
jgi:hypothetical protein